MCFAQGGNPPGVAGACAVALALPLLARVLAAPETVHRPSGAALAAMATLAALATWSLASMLWSGAEDLAVRDATRDLLYLVVLAGVTTLPPAAVARATRALAVVVVGVGASSLLSVLWPGIVGVQGASTARLHFPVGYWNALGFLLAVGLVLA